MYLLNPLYRPSRTPAAALQITICACRMFTIIMFNCSKMRLAVVKRSMEEESNMDWRH